MQRYYQNFSKSPWPPTSISSTKVPYQMLQAFILQSFLQQRQAIIRVLHEKYHEFYFKSFTMVSDAQHVIYSEYLISSPRL